MKNLYQDKKIKIDQAKTPEEHDVFVEDLHCYLSRGILKDCANTDTKGLRQRLEAVHWSFLSQLSKKGVSLEELGWALSKARISELEEEVSYFIDRYNEVRGE